MWKYISKNVKVLEQKWHMAENYGSPLRENIFPSPDFGLAKKKSLRTEPRVKVWCPFLIWAISMPLILNLEGGPYGAVLNGGNPVP